MYKKIRVLKPNFIKKNSIIAIGASTEGTEAIINILKVLPKEMPGIVIVQHMPPDFTKLYAERLNNICELDVVEAHSYDKILPGRVLIAPGGYQMRIKRNASELVVELVKEGKINGHSPSIDFLFKSVAEHMGSNAIGILLTGMGYDGAKGLLDMRKRGAITIGQEDKSSDVNGMLEVAFKIGAVKYHESLENIPSRLYSVFAG